MKVVCQLWVFDWQQRWPCSSSSISLITTQYWVADLKNWNIKWPKNRKTCLYLVFLHMALAFLLLQTGFTKGSEDCRLNHRWKIMRMSMTTLQRYIYDQRLPHGSGQKAVTDSKKKKRKQGNRLETPQYNIRQGTNQMDWVDWNVVVADNAKMQSRHDSLFCT